MLDTFKSLVKHIWTNMRQTIGSETGAPMNNSSTLQYIQNHIINTPHKHCLKIMTTTKPFIF